MSEKIIFEFATDVEVSTSDFWYDVTMGGYIKPEQLLANDEHIAKVKEALEIIRQFEQQAHENEVLVEL